MSTSTNHAHNGAVSSTELKEFLYQELRDIYWAEKYIIKGLPKLIKSATSPELKQAIEEHLAITQFHVQRLEQVFELLSKKAHAKKCEALEGILKEGDSIIELTKPGTATRDIGLIMAAQKVEHYEMATYRGLLQVSKTLGLQGVAILLETTLQEEKQADEILTRVAEISITYDSDEQN